MQASRTGEPNCLSGRTTASASSTSPAWQQTTATARVSPPPISSATILSGDPVLTIPTSPFYPHALAQQFGVDGQPLEVFWRGLELGPRTDENETSQYRAVGGLQGNVYGWDYNA